MVFQLLFQLHCFSYFSLPVCYKQLISSCDTVKLDLTAFCYEKVRTLCSHVVVLNLWLWLHRLFSFVVGNCVYVLTVS